MERDKPVEKIRTFLIQTEAFWKMETRFIRLNFEAWLEEPKFESRGEITLFKNLVKAKENDINDKFWKEINRR